MKTGIFSYTSTIEMNYKYLGFSRHLPGELYFKMAFNLKNQISIANQHQIA
jgi:hypothetical protein